MLQIKNAVVDRSHQPLISDLNLELYEKQVIGIVGANGCGKSTLFEVIKGNLDPHAGEVNLKRGTRISYLTQEVNGEGLTALAYTLAGDEKISALYVKLHQAEVDEDYDVVCDCHAKLAECDGYALEAKASKILAGLGFSQDALEKSVTSFSGGWRMRLNLARCLLTPADLLLLDEPTNHLDMEAILWLEKFIQHFSGAVLMVSHDRDFLDNVVTHIAHVENASLRLWKGDYSNFEIQRARDIMLKSAQYKKQQAKIEHMMKFVDRFQYKATKARQAQSRLKAIEKMEVIKPIHEASPFHFQFRKPDRMPSPMVKINKASLGYGEEPVLSKLNYSLAAGDRVGLLGINGAGKSTFIKGLCGELRPMIGSIEISPGVAIGYFAQHQVDELDLSMTPLEEMRLVAKGTMDRDLISYLGSFGFGLEQSSMRLSCFSGGEKSRVALAKIIWQRPNLLLLDEPTNHLDLETRQALMFALQEYEGALILVSHDRYLHRSLVDGLLIVKDGELSTFDGSIDEYQ